MNHEWCVEKLDDFIDLANRFLNLYISHGEYQMNGLMRDYEAKMFSLEPVVKKIVSIYIVDFRDFGDYEYSQFEYWSNAFVISLRAKGVCENYEEMAVALSPDTPFIEASAMHEWVWGAAKQLWNAEAFQEAVGAAARNINARIQKKSGRTDISESDLVMQVFDIKEPEIGKPRLWLPGDRTTPTWRSVQEGVKFFGAGCFKAIRNPAAHAESTNWREQEALEYITSFSVFARWIENSELNNVN